MIPYHKIQTIFQRDQFTNYKTLLLGKWSQPEFELLANCIWVGEEKVEGTNIRIIWDGEQVAFKGRTDNADIPPALLHYLESNFPAHLLKQKLKGPVTLYGEGYGGKIQKAGTSYSKTEKFILFDVLADFRERDVWLDRETMEDIAFKLEIDSTPELFVGTLWDAVTRIFSYGGFDSEIAEEEGMPAEGLVLRPKYELNDRFGNRIITKIKNEDFVQ